MNSYYNRNRLPFPWEHGYGQQGYYPQQQGMYPQQSMNYAQPQMGMGSGLLGGFARQDKNATVASNAYTNYVNDLLAKNAPQYMPQPQQQQQGLFGFSQQPQRRSLDYWSDYGGGGNNGDGS